MRTRTRRRPRRWILGAFLVLLVAAGAIGYFSARGPTPSQIAGQPTGNGGNLPTEGADTVPSGCLGGPVRDAAMVSVAQDLAPQTAGGGVDVAAAFVRWLIQYPYPTASDSDRLATTALASDAPTKDLTGFFATGPNLSGGLVPDSTDYYLSTIPGVWHLESSSGTEVEATIGTGVVINGELSPNLRGSITVTLRWEGGKWKFVKSVGTRSTEDLYSIGKPFASGC